MGDLDFSGLRGEVEAATRLPGFDSVERRGRRVRAVARWKAALTACAAAAVVAPLSLVGLNLHRSTLPTFLGQPPVVQQSPPEPAPGPAGAPVTMMYDVAGVRLDSLYAAVDTCRPAPVGSSCSLQVTPLTLGGLAPRRALAAGELRLNASDRLSDVQLLPLSARSLLLSGIGVSGLRMYRRINVSGGGTDALAVVDDAALPGPGDRLVQLRPYGEPYYVRQSDDQLIRLAGAPQLESSVVLSTIDPQLGWWLSGVDPTTKQVTVAVSHNQGGSWTVQPLGVRPGFEGATLATYDGTTAYAFVRTVQGIIERRTTDGGASWHAVPSTMSWPRLPSGVDAYTRRLGAVVRPDGSLLVWLEDEPAIVYLQSFDRGQSFRSTAGPAGRVVTVTDGYAAVDSPLVISRDAYTWIPVPGPTFVAPS